MKLIGRSKISKINPKPNIVYPMIRLPQECADTIGMTATIYETEYDGKKAFLITIGQDADTATPVMKPELQNSLEKRLSDVESKINDIYSRLMGKESQKSCKTEKEVSRWRDLNPRPADYESAAIPLSHSGNCLRILYVRN